MTTGQTVATWCVAMRDKKEGGEKTIHVKCNDDCITYKDGGNRGLADSEGKNKHNKPGCFSVKLRL